MSKQLTIYVYQMADDMHDAVLYKGWARGRVVEEWPVNTIQQCKFAVTHGSAYRGARDRVAQLAELAMQHHRGEIVLTFPQETARASLWQRCKGLFRRR